MKIFEASIQRIMATSGKGSNFFTYQPSSIKGSAQESSTQVNTVIKEKVADVKTQDYGTFDEYMEYKKRRNKRSLNIEEF